MRRGMVTMSVRGGRALVYYNANRIDGLWFVEIEEINVDGIVVDDRLTIDEEQEICRYIEHQLDKEGIYGR